MAEATIAEEPLFYLKEDGEERGPLTAKELLEQKVGVDARVRRDGEEGWRRFAELIQVDSEVVSALEGEIDPDYPPPERWQTRGLTEFSWIALLLSVEAVWILIEALSQRSAEAWGSAAFQVGTMVLVMVGVLARRPWAWTLAALVLGVIGIRMLSLAITTGAVSAIAFLMLHVLAVLYLQLRRPRGEALDWSPRLRRLVLCYSRDPAQEGRARFGRAPRSVVRVLTIAGVFFAVVLGAVWLYHFIRFPQAELGLTLVPRGGDYLSWIGALSVYGAMVAVSFLFGGLWLEWRQSKRSFLPDSSWLRPIWLGFRVFLVLAFILVAGRWTMRTVEVIEARIAVDAGAAATTPPAVRGVREALRSASVRETPAGSFDLGFALYFYFVTLLLGPICEEFFFRGFIFRGLRSRWPFWAAALVSAAFFAVTHWPGAGWGAASPILVFEITCGGIAAAYAYEVSGSLLAPMTLHVLWNTTQELAHTSQYLA